MANDSADMRLEDGGQVRGIEVTRADPAGELFVPDTVVTYMLHNKSNYWNQKSG